MRLTVATAFPTWPPDSGAALRNYHLYSAIARHHTVDIVSLVKKEAGELAQIIAPGLTETRITISDRHLEAELAICARAGGRPVGDFAVGRLHPFSPRFGMALSRSCADADILVASHPHLFQALRARSNRPLVYEAPDVEIDLKTSHLPHDLDGRRLLSQIERAEALCLAEADLILACNDYDRDRFIHAYGVDPARIHVARNGVDVDGVPFRSWRSRLAHRKSIQTIDDRAFARLTCLFLASLGGPNNEAALFVGDLARQMPDVRFIIGGSVGRLFVAQSLPPNLTVRPDISESDKLALLAEADVALNPVLRGSGDNIKMGEYALAGLWVITTPFGARGLPSRLSSLLDIVDLDGFADAILAVEQITISAGNARTQALRSWFTRHRNWADVGDLAVAALEDLVVSSPRARVEEVSVGDLISVLVPMFDAEDWIEETLASILGQTHSNLEVIIVDDGSTDGSRQKVEAWAVRDERVRIVHHFDRGNRGVNRSLELALQNARGDFIAFCDADDIWEPAKVTLQLDMLAAHPEAVACHTLASVFGNADPAFIAATQRHFDYQPQDQLYDVFQENGLGMSYVLNSSLMVRKDAMRNSPFGATQIYQSEDHLITLMVASLGPFALLSQRLVRYRLHRRSYTSCVLTNLLRDLYSRLEMLLILVGRTPDETSRDRVRRQIEATLWLLETAYADDAPHRFSVTGPIVA